MRPRARCAASVSAHLVTALLQIYWADGVTQGKAARLLGIRKAEFAELADLRMVAEGLERAALGYFEECLNYRFPECDLRCAPGDARAYQGTPRDAHAKDPSPKECRLLEAPQRRTIRELVPSPVKPDADLVRYLMTHRVPMWKRFPDQEKLTGTESEALAVK